VQVHDDRHIFQASPGELPAIDIHSRVTKRKTLPKCH
jgi:hypothetical protein